MKNLEKYVIVILSVIAVVAIGTALYFGVNLDKNETKKEEEKQQEVGENDNNNLVQKIYLEPNVAKIININNSEYKFLKEGNVLYINDKILYKLENFYKYIEHSVYVTNSFVMLVLSASDVRGNSFVFLDFEGNVIKEFETWNENKLLYWINGNLSEGFDKYINVYAEDENIIIEFPFTAVTHGPTITSTTDEVREIVLDSKNNLEIIKNKLNINDDTIIEGTAKMVYKSNGEFSKVEIIDGKTILEYTEMIIADINN